MWRRKCWRAPTREGVDVPTSPITTPEHAPAITRTTLGVISTREAAAPSWGSACTYTGCSAPDDE